MKLCGCQSRGGSGRVNGRGGKMAVAPTRSRKKILSWVDTPDEVYFVADTSTRYAVRVFRQAVYSWHVAVIVTDNKSEQFVKWTSCN